MGNMIPKKMDEYYDVNVMCPKEYFRKMHFTMHIVVNYGEVKYTHG